MIIKTALTSILFCSATLAQAPPPTALPATSMPVREVTVFKDGHAYLLRETALSPNAGGKVVLEDLPAPLLGTFWPFATGGARLLSARSGLEDVATSAPATDLRQIAKANIGKQVVVIIGDELPINGKLLAVPAHQSGGDLLLVQTATGTRALPLQRVRDLEIRGEFTGELEQKQRRARLTLEVAGGGPNAKVGLMYVQRGLRWIPSYRLDIDGEGKAVVQMQATLVNDLIDLEGAAVNLVIGVPKFAFEGLVDAIALQREVAQVAANTGSPAFSNFLSNSLMTQVAGYAAPSGRQPTGQPAVEGGQANEDLFVYSLADVTLAKGERLVVPVASFELPYRDVYRFELPFAPPMEVREGLQSQRVFELARQLAAPKVRHVLRLENTSLAPLTTAPVLVLAKGRVLAQGHMFYTPTGATTDLEINVAIDVCVDTEDRETSRATEVRLAGHSYNRVDLQGWIELHNTKDVPIEIEVTRRVLGLVDEAGQDGEHKQLDLVQAWSGGSQPGWWSWWSWPHWWFRHNGFGEFSWQVDLEPGKKVKLVASWHYYWR